MCGVDPSLIVIKLLIHREDVKNGMVKDVRRKTARNMGVPGGAWMWIWIIGLWIFG